MTEALEFLLLTAGDAVTTLDPDEADLMSGLSPTAAICWDGSATCTWRAKQALSPADKLLLLKLTTQFDRVVWMVRRLAELLRQNRQFRP